MVDVVGHCRGVTAAGLGDPAGGARYATEVTKKLPLTGTDVVLVIGNNTSMQYNNNYK